MKVPVSQIANFQPCIFPEFMLDGQVILPTIRHLVARLATDRGTPEAIAKASRLAGRRLCRRVVRVRLHVQEAPIVGCETLEEWGIVSAYLKREKAVAVKELAHSTADRPLAVARGIPREAQARSEHVIVVIPKSAIGSNLTTGEEALRHTWVLFESGRIKKAIARRVQCRGGIRRRVEGSVKVVSEIRIGQ